MFIQTTQRNAFLTFEFTKQIKLSHQLQHMKNPVVKGATTQQIGETQSSQMHQLVQDKGHEHHQNQQTLDIDLQESNNLTIRSFSWFSLTFLRHQCTV